MPLSLELALLFIVPRSQQKEEAMAFFQMLPLSLPKTKTRGGGVRAILTVEVEMVAAFTTGYEKLQERHCPLISYG